MFGMKDSLLQDIFTSSYPEFMLTLILTKLFCGFTLVYIKAKIILPYYIILYNNQHLNEAQ